MSNQQVGPVFERVIQEVCDASQVDFEESGVDQKTLHDMRETWQQKLSSLQVAHFPWDPPPPQPAPQAPVLPPQATVPSNAPRPPPQNVNPPVSMSQPIPQNIPAPQVPMAAGGPRIKAEPGTIPPVMPGMNNTMQIPTNPQHARERAISAMQQKYGANAANSVHQLQAQAPGQQPYPQMHPGNGQMPQVKQEYPSMGPGQTDGGGDDPLTDWKAEVARRREAAQNGHGDHLLREHLKSQMLDFQAGGLMRPMAEHETPAAAGRRRAAEAHLNVAQARSTETVPRIPGQYDGEEADEDAINSDLDDPDDALADDAEADDQDGQVMLCTYDKVQRVKNKWKCTLKDGILTSNGKEYVFHKGQGEFEW